jgi:hypothetical protein
MINLGLCDLFHSFSYRVPWTKRRNAELRSRTKRKRKTGRNTHNQCCGSGMFIPYPDFYPSRIPDPKTATKERGKKNFFIPFL